MTVNYFELCEVILNLYGEIPGPYISSDHDLYDAAHDQIIEEAVQRMTGMKPREFWKLSKLEQMGPLKKTADALLEAEYGPTVEENEIPELSASTEQPTYLDLEVDEARGEVRRKGFPDKLVEFETDSAEWHTFLVAFRAGERGATNAEWKKDYPAEWRVRRKRKRAAADKLERLRVKFEPSNLKLVELDQ